MTAVDKARQVAESLRPEPTNEETALQEAKEELTQLAVIKNDSVLAKMYADNASIGSANLGGELPQLKVHATGRSTKNELADGSEPNDGYFFYKPTGEQFKEIEAHILTISRGFHAEGMPDAQGKTRQVFNQIMGGVVIDGSDLKPFVMYFTGTKLQNLWEFGKQVSKYTKAKPVSIPMFALTVKLTTEKKENNFGKSWVINFDIVKADDGNPKLVLDPEEFGFLRDNAISLEETIKNLIDSREAQEEEVQPIDGVPVSSDNDRPEFLR